MLVKCDECGFEESPANWTVIYKTTETQQLIFFVCPVCEKMYFLQHFNMPVATVPNAYGLSFSHLFSASVEECATRAEATEFMVKKRKELKKKFNRVDAVGITDKMLEIGNEADDVSRW